MITIDIERFSEAQELYDSYQTALAEVKQDTNRRIGYGISFLRYKD